MRRPDELLEGLQEIQSSGDLMPYLHSITRLAVQQASPIQQGQKAAKKLRRRLRLVEDWVFADEPGDSCASDWTSSSSSSSEVSESSDRLNFCRLTVLQDEEQ